MTRRIVVVAVALCLALAVVTPTGMSPVLASTSAVQCAVPSAGSSPLFEHPSKYGIHGAEMAYQRSQIGCIPPASTGRSPLAAALAQQKVLPNLTPVGASWVPIGPAPIDTPGDSGRLISMVYDSDLSGGTMFVGAAGGGVWSSTSPFTSWTTHTDSSLASLAIGALAVANTNPTVLYAGTGEQASCYDCLYGQGVYKTTDGGLTWNPTGAPAGGWGTATISSIAVSPVNNNDIFVSEGSGLYTSGDVFISHDAGATWTKVQVASGHDDSVSSLTVDPSGNVYAAVGASFGSQAENGVYECAAPCTGTFSLIGGGSGGADNFPAGSATYSIKISETGTGAGTTLYAIASSSAGGTKMLGVYRLVPNTSSNWTQIALPAVQASYEDQAWYNMYIAADPSNANNVYFGLSDIYRSSNAAGATPTWTNLTNVYGVDGTGVHPDQHAAAIVGSTIYFGNDGGIWQFNSGTSAFTDLNGNLATLEFYGGSLGTSAAEGCTSNCDVTARIAGTQDNGTPQTTGGASVWTSNPNFGDGGYALIDPVNNNNRYGENANGDIMFSTNGGPNFNDAGIGNTCGASTFIAPLAFDPSTSSTLFAGMRDLCMNTSASSPVGHWVDASSGITTGALAAIATSNTGGGREIYISDVNGHTYTTTSTGSPPYTWENMDLGAAGGPLAAISLATGQGPASAWNFGLEVTGIAADPTTAGVAYVTVNGFQGSSAKHVFKWTAGGANGTWTDISGNLPDEPYDTIAVNPTSGALYVGGITGAFVSTNGGTSWNQMGRGLPNVQVDNLQVSRDGVILVAFTHGRSAWEINASPTAATYARLNVRVSHGWTFVHWRAAQPVLGFNVFRNVHQVNHRLVTSRTHNYSFSYHGVLRHPILVAVARHRA